METSVRDEDSIGLTLGVFDRRFGGIRISRRLVAHLIVYCCKVHECLEKLIHRCSICQEQSRNPEITELVSYDGHCGGHDVEKHGYHVAHDWLKRRESTAVTQ